MSVSKTRRKRRKGMGNLNAIDHTIQSNATDTQIIQRSYGHLKRASRVSSRIKVFINAELSMAESAIITINIVQSSTTLVSG